MSGNKDYLGDAVYVEQDPYLNGVKIYTSDGVSELNKIYMDQYVIKSFCEYLERIKND